MGALIPNILPGPSGIISAVTSLFETEQKYPNARESHSRMLAAGAPAWLADAAINRAYGYAGPGYLAGVRVLKRDLESQQRDAAALAQQIAGYSVGKVLTEAQWLMTAQQLGLDIPPSLSMSDAVQLSGGGSDAGGGGSGLGFGGSSGPLLLVAAAALLFLAFR